MEFIDYDIESSEAELDWGEILKKWPKKKTDKSIKDNFVCENCEAKFLAYENEFFFPNEKEQAV